MPPKFWTVFKHQTSEALAFFYNEKDMWDYVQKNPKCDVTECNSSSFVYSYEEIDDKIIYALRYPDGYFAGIDNGYLYRAAKSLAVDTWFSHSKQEAIKLQKIDNVNIIRIMLIY